MSFEATRLRELMEDFSGTAAAAIEKSSPHV